MRLNSKVRSVTVSSRSRDRIRLRVLAGICAVSSSVSGCGARMIAVLCVLRDCRAIIIDYLAGLN